MLLTTATYKSWKIISTVTSLFKAHANPIYKELCKINASKTARYIGTYRYGGTLAELADTNAKAIYCECEFHDNKTYAQHIINNATVYGEAIAKGVCSAFGVTYKAVAPANKVLDKQGYKYGQKSDGVLAIKELLLLAKTLKIHNCGLDENGSFGNGTKKAVNTILKKWGYEQNGIAGDNFIKKLTAEIRKKI